MISIIIPVYNEGNLVRTCFDRISPYLGPDDEVIFVNDGSHDDTGNCLERLMGSEPRAKSIELSRNFGQQPAISAGLQYSSGDAVIVMDCDLQDPPELIPSLVEKWRSGFDIVHCIRKKREQVLWKKICYAVFYRLYTRMTEFPTQMQSGDFSIMSRRVVDVINRMEEQIKFIRGLRAFVGFRQTTLEFDRPDRMEGEPKYNLAKLFRLALDGIFSFTTFPLRLMLMAGCILLVLSFLMICVLIYAKLFHELAVGHTMTYVLVLFFGGINLFCFGILGEYIGKIFYETKRRPYFIVKTFHNLDERVKGRSNP